ncbi:MAG: DUF3093 family protein [Mycobacteriales bacterium]
MYDEKLRVPPWWHAVAVGFAALFGGQTAALFSGNLGAQAVVYFVVLLMVEVLLWWVSRGRIHLAGGALQVGNWRLPLAQVRTVVPLGAADTRQALRWRGDGAYRYIRGWIATSVRLEVDDPEDAPVWLFSTRHPDALAAALLRARADVASERSEDHGA